MKRALIGLLRAYRFAISPMYGQVCRYYPSCSAYALEAVDRHGAWTGSWLAVRRVLRCHPWAAGGVDHVPGHGADSWAHSGAHAPSETGLAAGGTPIATRSARIAVK